MQRATSAQPKATAEFHEEQAATTIRTNLFFRDAGGNANHVDETPLDHSDVFQVARVHRRRAPCTATGKRREASSPGPARCHTRAVADSAEPAGRHSFARTTRHACAHGACAHLCRRITPGSRRSITPRAVSVSMWWGRRRRLRLLLCFLPPLMAPYHTLQPDTDIKHLRTALDMKNVCGGTAVRMGTATRTRKRPGPRRLLSPGTRL